MARVELRGDLNAVVARMVAGKVKRLADEVADEARRRAPAARVWQNVDDERVRPAHVEADGQLIPGNLRFKLRKQVYVRGGGRGSDVGGRTVLAPGYVLAREPRDEDLPPDQRENCRCADVTYPKMIAERIVAGPVSVNARRARARVQVRFPRIVESEHGTSQDPASRFMGGAVETVAARLRAKGRR